MTPPIDLPPPPPAIHAPVPHHVAQNAATPISNAGAQQVVNPYIRMPHSSFFLDENKGRYMHTRHHKGAKHKSQRSRSNKRKAARRK